MLFRNINRETGPLPSGFHTIHPAPMFTNPTLVLFYFPYLPINYSQILPFTYTPGAICNRQLTK